MIQEYWRDEFFQNQVQEIFMNSNITHLSKIEAIMSFAKAYYRESPDTIEYLEKFVFPSDSLQQLIDLTLRESKTRTISTRIRAIDQKVIIPPVINKNDHVWNVTDFNDGIKVFIDWISKNKEKKGLIWQLIFEIET